MSSYCCCISHHEAIQLATIYPCDSACVHLQQHAISAHWSVLEWEWGRRYSAEYMREWSHLCHHA